MSSFQKCPAALVDRRGLLFPGEFIASMNIAMLLLSPEGTTILIVPKEHINATNILALYLPKKFQVRSCAENPGDIGTLLVDACHGIDQKSEKCLGIVGGKSCQGKQFIVNFIFGVTPVFSSIVVA